jgi:hypothetical protein
MTRYWRTFRVQNPESWQALKFELSIPPKNFLLFNFVCRDGSTRRPLLGSQVLDSLESV